MHANRTFSSTSQKQPNPAKGFNPGGDDFAVIRMVDGHDPYQDGLAGTNEHAPDVGDPMWHDCVSEYEACETD